MDWDRLIQTLDRGSYDVGRVVKALRRAGYNGPIGLQCYGIPGDNRENLKRSMKAWREIRSRSAKDLLAVRCNRSRRRKHVIRHTPCAVVGAFLEMPNGTRCVPDTSFTTL